MSSFRKIKLFFSNGIGDLIMALPTIRAFLAYFGSDVGLIIGNDLPREMLSFLGQGQIEIVDIRRVEGRRWIGSDSGPGECDIFVSLVQWHNESVLQLASKTGAKLTIGHYKSFGLHVPLFDNVHCIDQTFRLFAMFSSHQDCGMYSGPLTFDSRIKGSVATLKGRLGKVPLLVCHLDSAKSKVPAPQWTNSVLCEVRQRTNCAIVLIGRNSMLASLSNVDAEILDSLELCMLLAAEADVFLGIDSCMLHVADLHRRTSVGVFVSTDPKEYGFRFSKNFIHIVHEQNSYSKVGIHSVSEYLSKVLASTATT